MSKLEELMIESYQLGRVARMEYEDPRLVETVPGIFKKLLEKYSSYEIALIVDQTSSTTQDGNH